MVSVNRGNHSDCQNFVVTNLLKYYPVPDALTRSTRNIIEHFLTLIYPITNSFMTNKYSEFDTTPRTPFCMQRPYLLPIDFKIKTRAKIKRRKGCPSP